MTIIKKTIIILSFFNTLGSILNVYAMDSFDHHPLFAAEKQEWFPMGEKKTEAREEATHKPNPDAQEILIKGLRAQKPEISMRLIQQAIQNGANINAQLVCKKNSKKWWYPLEYAIEHKNFEVSILLLKAGADIRNGLTHASTIGNIQLIQQILHAPQKPTTQTINSVLQKLITNNYPRMTMDENNWHTIIKMLVLSGANPTIVPWEKLAKTKKHSLSNPERLSSLEKKLSVWYKQREQNWLAKTPAILEELAPFIKTKALAEIISEYASPLTGDTTEDLLIIEHINAIKPTDPAAYLSHTSVSSSSSAYAGHKRKASQEPQDLYK